MGGGHNTLALFAPLNTHFNLTNLINIFCSRPCQEGAKSQPSLSSTMLNGSFSTLSSTDRRIPSDANKTQTTQIRVPRRKLSSQHWQIIREGRRR